MRTGRMGRFAAAVFAVAIVAAGCGSDDGDGGDDASATESEPADSGSATDDGEATGGDDGDALSVPDNPDSGVTADEILVGWMGDITGPTASAQALNLSGIEAYFDYVNSQGGVLGRELVLSAKDDQYSAETAVSNYQSLVNDENVLAINQVGGSQVISAIASDVERDEIPVFSLAQTVDESLAMPHAFHNLAHYGDQADVAAQYMADEIGSAEDVNVMVVQLEVPSGDEWNGYIQQSVEEMGGTYVGRETINPAQPDATAVVTAIRQAIDDDGANFIALHAAPSQALLVVNSLADEGIEIPIIGIQGVASLNVYEEGDDAQAEQTAGVHSFKTYADESEGGAIIEEFINGDGSDYAEDAKHINFSHGWVGGMVLHQAIERAADQSGELTRQSLFEAFQGEFDTMGLSCPINWTDSNHSPCAAPFTGSGDGQMTIIGEFEEWAETLDAEYDLGA